MHPGIHVIIFLMSKGIQAGTRVAIAAEQTSFFLIAVSALHLIGAVVIPLEKNLSDVRISELMIRMKSVWLIGRMNISVQNINLLL